MIVANHFQGEDRKLLKENIIYIWRSGFDSKDSDSGPVHLIGT